MMDNNAISFLPVHQAVESYNITTRSPHDGQRYFLPSSVLQLPFVGLSKDGQVQQGLGRRGNGQIPIEAM